MSLSPLLRNARLVQWGIRIDTAPSWWWLAAHLATLGLVWALAAHPLPGLALLLFVAGLLWPLRGRLRAAPRLGWLALALCGTLAAPFAHGHAAPAGMALLASGALMAGLLAFLPAGGRGGIWPPSGNTFLNRVLHKTAFGGGLLLCAAWAAAQAVGA